MKLQINWMHVVMVLAGAASGGAMAWASVDPSHVSTAHAIVAACGSIGTFLGLVSGPVVGKAQTPPAGQ